MARVKTDPAFRSELIIEATNAFLMDEMETGKALLRDYLDATESIAEMAGNWRLTRRASAYAGSERKSEPQELPQPSQGMQFGGASLSQVCHH